MEDVGMAALGCPPGAARLWCDRIEIRGGTYVSIFFFVTFPKILIPKNLRARDLGGSGQNPEPQGLTAKIFSNKDLASNLSPVMKLLVEPSCIRQPCAFQNSWSRLFVTRTGCGKLWKKQCWGEG
jgi:hypothetical protein